MNTQSTTDSVVSNIWGIREKCNLIFCMTAYFFLGLFMGSLTLFALLWLIDKDVSVALATTLVGFTTILTVFAVNGFSHYADTSTGGRKRVIQILLALSLVAVALWEWTGHGLWLYGAFVAGLTLSGAIMPFLDGITIQMIPIREKRILSFTTVRSLMTLGYVIGSIVIGHFIDIYGLGILTPIGVVFLAIVLLATGILNVDSIPQAKHKKGHMWGHVLTIPWVKSFLLVILIYGFGGSFWYGLVTVHFEALGFSKRDMGLLILFGNVTEILVFVFGSLVIQRFRPLALMAFCSLVGAIRWWLLSDHSGFWEVGFITALHGINFALFHSSASYFIQRNIPAEMSSSAQSIFQTAMIYVPFAIGFPLGGYLYPIMGGDIYKLGAVITFISFAFCLWVLWTKKPSPPTPPIA